MANMKSGTHRAGGAGQRRAAGTGPGAHRPAADRAASPALDLGRTARRLRESQNLTLADVAGRANISSAMAVTVSK